MNIKWVGAHSNNYGSRYNNKIQYVILHWIAGTLESCDATFQNPTRYASAHYGVGDSDVHQYVSENDCAWHAGNLLMNRQSIGIETEGSPTLPITEASYKTLAELVKDICNRYSIPIDREHIKGHREVSDKATQCPGTLDIDKVISLIKRDSMTDEESRIIKYLKVENSFSEGNVREGMEDFRTKAERNKALETERQKNASVINELTQKLADYQKAEKNWQKELTTTKDC
jgi:N-acetylmuramoyl-L-alanine amidase CwlA